VPAGVAGVLEARFTPLMGVAAPLAGAYFCSRLRLGGSSRLVPFVSHITLAAVTGYFGHPEPPERVIPSTTGQPQTSRGGEDVTVIRSGTTPDTARGTT